MEQDILTPRVLTLKVNHEEQEVDVNSLTDEDLTARLQKAEAFDAMRSAKEEAGDFRNQVHQLRQVYPDFAAMPEEVMQAYMKGSDLLSAYSAYRVARMEQESRDIRKENEILKQNAASAAMAPVKGVSGAAADGDDAFLKGFDADRW